MLYAIAAIILLIVGFLFLSLNIHIRYEGQAVSVSLKVLFLKFNIYSDASWSTKKTPPKKTEKKKAKKQAKKKADNKHPEQKKRSLSDIQEALCMISSIVSSLKDRFLSTLKITAARIYISVGSDNATKTALLYGAICQGVTFLMEYLDSITRLKTVRQSEIHVGCDFSAESTVAEVHLIFSMQVRHLLEHAFRILKLYMVHKFKKSTQNITDKEGKKQ